MAMCQCFNQTIVVSQLFRLSEHQWVRAVIFFALMLSLFMGIAIIADIFMCSIERITSSTKKVIRRKPGTTEFEVIETPVWNKTVANLTLMALGSSAPEILLATIEIIGNGFTADELGPGCIVGASAFNLFIITAFCVIAIPNNETKRIFAIKVFGVSSFFNIFAYIWLYLVLKVFTPDEVNLTEAVFTLLFLPIFVITGYCADRNFFRREQWQTFGAKHTSNREVNEKVLSKFIKEVRKIENSLTAEECEQLAKLYIFKNQKHSQMFYRISAIRFLSGQTSNSPIPQLNEKLQNIYDIFEKNLSKPRSESTISDSLRLELEKSVSNESTTQTKTAIQSDITFLGFQLDSVTVKESEPYLEVIVLREGRLDEPAVCEVETIDRTALANYQFKPVKEVVVFAPNETEKKVTIELMKDHEWSAEKMFLVKLSLPNSAVNKNVRSSGKSIMQVTVADDNEPGIVEFVQRFFVVANTQAVIEVPLIRCQGSDGEVKVHWKTIDGSAKNMQHFFGGEGEVVFGEGVVRKDIQIPIINDLDERSEYYLEIVLVSATSGGMIGRFNRAMITITDDQNYDNAMKKIIPKLAAQSSLVLHRDEWLDQFRDAFTFSPETEDHIEVAPIEYVLHFLSFGWKVLFAFIPPTRLCGGWLTFFASLCVIGLLTALMGDFASTFGCLVGLSDHVTALTFVALGTSLPDLFASRVAALKEQYADNAIGNIFGSNAFNVFLGLGLPWFVATIYHKANGTRFSVDSDSLEFSVTLFIVLSLVYSLFLLIRRNTIVFGFAELGGPRASALCTFAVLVAFWILYIGLSIYMDVS